MNKMKRLQKKKLNYSFKNELLLCQALTRQKAIEEKVEGAAHQSYPSLKFVGEAMLKVCVTRSLYKKFPQIEAEQLHDLVQKFIKDKKLSSAARRLNLQDYIIKGKSELVTDKMLADALEAVIGAICLDSPKIGRVCQVFVEGIFKTEFRKLKLSKAKLTPRPLSVISQDEVKEASLRAPQPAAASARKRPCVRAPGFWSLVPQPSPVVPSLTPLLQSVSPLKRKKESIFALPPEAKEPPLQVSQHAEVSAKKEKEPIKEGKTFKQAFDSGPAGIFKTLGELYQADLEEYDLEVEAFWKAHFD